MKLAIIGSRSITDLCISEFLPDGITEIVSGGARGVDSIARKYAIKNNIKLTEFLPDYQKFGKRAPLIRNEKIAEYSDEAIAFWDGRSTGTIYTVRLFRKMGKKVVVIKVL